MPRNTIFSPCRRYRYVLWREWGDLLNPSTAFVQFIGLNPSTADETLDDPTIRRCVQYAKDWGYGALCMTNLFAFRATDPKVMIKEPDPEGPENIKHLADVAAQASVIVCAWGKDGKHQAQDAAVRQYLRCVTGVNLHCLGTNGDGTPKHPLYLKKTLVPVPFAPETEPRT